MESDAVLKEAGDSGQWGSQHVSMNASAPTENTEKQGLGRFAETVLHQVADRW